MFSGGDGLEWRFNDETPIYIQIMEQIRTMIATGEMAEGDKIPPVRELAISAGVNPNTMQKALAELEREGLLRSERTSGRFVSGQNGEGSRLQEDLMHKYMDIFTDNMQKLGIKPEEAAKLYGDYVKLKK